jgi:hypothetical protein
MTLPKAIEARNAATVVLAGEMRAAFPKIGALTVELNLIRFSRGGLWC